MNEALREEALEHFGVKGMKWGITRSKPTGNHPDYPGTQRSKDELELGRSGVSRINKRMNDGKTHAEAVQAERKLQKTQRAVKIGAAATLLALQVVGPVLMSEVSRKAETNRARRADTTPGLSARKEPKKVKPNRRGVYNITTM